MLALIASANWDPVRGAGGVAPEAAALGVAVGGPVLLGGIRNWSTRGFTPGCLAAAAANAAGDWLDWPTIPGWIFLGPGVTCCPPCAGDCWLPWPWPSEL